MVTKADVSGKNVDETDSEFAFAASQEEVTVKKPVCAPLAYAMNQLPLGEPQADLTRVVNGDPNQAFTYVTLTTYESGRAESTMPAFRRRSTPAAEVSPPRRTATRARTTP